MWFKKEMKAYHEWLERQVRGNDNIFVLTNAEATPELVSDINPDATIVAVGAKQIVPSIPGIEKAVMAFDVFGNEDKIGKKIVIIGGGDIGCELSIHLSERGHECTVVELTHFQAGNAELCLRMSILQFMEKEHVTTLLDTRATEITDSGVHVETEEGKKFLPADTVIVSVGTTPLAEERDRFRHVSFDVINVGDCKKASNMQHAVETGFDAGIIL